METRDTPVLGEVIMALSPEFDDALDRLEKCFGLVKSFS